MERQFVTPRLTGLLLELGFEEECLNYYWNYYLDGEWLFDTMVRHDSFDYRPGITWQQAIDWLFSWENLGHKYPMLELTVFSDGSGSWHQSYDDLTGNEAIDVDFENKEEMIIKALELCKKE